jgi:hypothetical protein
MAARRLGARTRRSRGLRFGLYSCGWDLVTLPLGFVLVAAVEGVAAAFKALPLGVTVPARAAEAYLTGVHKLEAPQVRAAMRFAGAVAGVPVVASITLMALAALALLF